ncbi:bZIP transcription factor 17-like [Euphorbia lathyris]|uniref:bZIP transcription factor 17-like n=1 Tax=Euphorbia lathyris TaxID=212925 RepID=UPI0033140E49
MAEAILTDHQPRPPPSAVDNGEFDSLPIPPLDPLFLSAQTSSLSDTHMATGENLGSDLHFSLDDNYDLDITFDDLEDFYFPSENEHFSIPNSAGHLDVSRHPEGSVSPESGSSGISGDHVSDVAKYLNCSPSESRCSDSGYQSSNSAAQLNSSSPASSQVSGNGGSGVSEAMNAPSPDSDSGAIVVDQKVKTEDVNVKKCSLPKRKKEITSEDTNDEVRKYLRSENSNTKTDATNSNSQCGSFVAVGDDDEKRKARLMRNRESAQLSRQRKKHYVEELEDKVRAMHSTIADLNGKISFFMAENATLRQQLSGNGMCNPPMYPPMAPMPYPWMPCAPYVVKSQGSQVPLVPIPRLKPQQPISASKPKKAEAKKAEGKTKKVASVSFLGLLFFVLLFGGMVPILNVRYGGLKENGANGFGFVSDKYYDKQRGRVLMVDGHSNGSHEKMDIDRIHCGRGRDGRVEHSPNSDNFANLNDSSKQLAASLYVPRNDKLVKIDGNLIIHSVLATERAMASHDVPEVNKNKETSLALPKDFSPALAIPGMHSHSDVSSNRGVHPQRYRTPNEGHNALPSRSSDTLKDQLKTSAANGKLQQWFHEGLAGPLLSSGMCTEVFQFDSSPAPGAIVAASSVANITSNRQNATRHTRAKNRRFLHGLQIPLSGSDLNITGEHVPSSQKDKFQGNKSVSSMVVSVLVDPRENSDSEVDGVIKPKSLSRIFVVVLMDSVKYVTYSCMLPRPGPHLVTT